MLKFYIPHREEGEELILLMRRHIFVIITKIGFWSIVALMPPLLFIIVNDVLKSLFENPFVGPISILFLSVYYLYVWLFAFSSFVDYYLDVWIVTNHRIINIEQQGLFARTVSEQRLEKIQDVTSEVKGLFQTMLDFGTVFIQTAGEEPRFIFKQIPDPYEVARKITKLSEQSKRDTAAQTKTNSL